MLKNEQDKINHTPLRRMIFLNKMSCVSKNIQHSKNIKSFILIVTRKLAFKFRLPIGITQFTSVLRIIDGL